MSWVVDGDVDAQPKRIMWLSGPAGSGKTAISGSVASECHRRGLLAASFFFSSFSGSANRLSKIRLIGTPASHLAVPPCFQEYKAELFLRIERDPEIFKKGLMEQAEYLLLAPFRGMCGAWDSFVWPKVIIIDGLDEVEAVQYHDRSGQSTQRDRDCDQLEILNLLLTLAQRPGFPFRILISSRPEPVIADFFATVGQATTINLFLDSKYDPCADIRSFLDARFTDIRRRAGMTNTAWPGQCAVDKIVEMSSGQFIVPATIIRWVEDGIPQVQLDEVLQLRPSSVKAKKIPLLRSTLYIITFLDVPKIPKATPT